MRWWGRYHGASDGDEVASEVEGMKLAGNGELFGIGSDNG